MQSCSQCYFLFLFPNQQACFRVYLVPENEPNRPAFAADHDHNLSGNLSSTDSPTEVFHDQEGDVDEVDGPRRVRFGSDDEPWEIVSAPRSSVDPVYSPREDRLRSSMTDSRSVRYQRERRFFERATKKTTCLVRVYVVEVRVVVFSSRYRLSHRLLCRSNYDVRHVVENHNMTAGRSPVAACFVLGVIIRQVHREPRLNLLFGG